MLLPNDVQDYLILFCIAKHVVMCGVPMECQLPEEERTELRIELLEKHWNWEKKNFAGEALELGEEEFR